MNRKFHITLLALFIGLVPLWISGCGTTETARTGFLKDYSKLKAHPDSDGRFRYINPKMNVGDYSKFIVDPVVLQLSKEGKEEEIDQEDLNEQVTFFHGKILEELGKDYQIVNKPGKGVARIRVAITHIDKTNPALNIHPGTKLTGAGLGGAGMEGEMVDSVTGETIGSVIDFQMGSRLSLVAGLTWFGHAQAVMEDWAEDIRKFIDKAHGKKSD